MTQLVPHLPRRLRAFSRDQQGITGIETAIILTAFVVVSSIFAVTSLSTGLITTDQTRGSVNDSLNGVRSTLELKGPILVTATTAGVNGAVSDIAFRVNGATAGPAIDLRPGNLIIKYSDKDQTVNLDTGGEFTTTGIGIHNNDSFLDPGEVFEIQIPGLETGEDNALSPQLGAGKDFTIELISPTGGGLLIERRTPLSLQTVTSLD